jgi:hypothetical protein
MKELDGISSQTETVVCTEGIVFKIPTGAQKKEKILLRRDEKYMNSWVKYGTQYEITPLRTPFCNTKMK